MLMRHPNHGWHDASGADVEVMKKNGWIESSYEEHAKVVAAKHATKDSTSNAIATPETPVVIQVPMKGKPGRKPKNPH